MGVAILTQSRPEILRSWLLNGLTGRQPQPFLLVADLLWYHLQIHTGSGWRGNVTFEFLLLQRSLRKALSDPWPDFRTVCPLKGSWSEEPVVKEGCKWPGPLEKLEEHSQLKVRGPSPHWRLWGQSREKTPRLSYGPGIEGLLYLYWGQGRIPVCKGRWVLLSVSRWRGGSIGLKNEPTDNLA